MWPSTLHVEFSFYVICGESATDKKMKIIVNSKLVAVRGLIGARLPLTVIRPASLQFLWTS